MGYYSLKGKKLIIRPTLDQASIAGAGKPTRVIRGLFQGFSLPIYAANQEMFYRTVIPDRWDDTTNVTAHLYAYLDTAQTVGDKFNMQFSYESANCETGILPLTTNDVPIETTIAEGRNSQYDVYCVDFTVPYTTISHGDLMAGRLRRLDASVEENEITGNIVVAYVDLEFNINKIFGEQ